MKPVPLNSATPGVLPHPTSRPSAGDPEQGAAGAVEARVARLLATSLHLDIPSVETDLFETGAIDSLAFVELLVGLEREFGVRVSVEDLEIDHFRTIRRITEFITSRNGHGPAAARDVPDPPNRAR